MAPKKGKHGSAGSGGNSPGGSSGVTTTSVTVGSVTMKPRKFEEDKEEFPDWLEHFEAVADVNGWSSADMCKYLVAVLPPRMLALYKSLPDPVKQSTVFDDVRAALVSKVLPSEKIELYKSEFRSRIRKPNESLEAFSMDLQKLALKAYPGPGMDGIRDELTKDQFIAGLVTSSIRLLVRQGKPKSLNDAVRIALELESFREVEKARNVVPVSEVEPGTSAEVAPVHEKTELEKIASALQQNQQTMQEMMKLMMQRGEGRERQRSSRLKCWTCGGDHVRRNCPKNGARPQ